MEMILLQAAGQNAGGGYSTIIMMVAIFVIFWLFMIRPQQKRQKELQQKREALGINDRIVTSGWPLRGDQGCQADRACRRDR